MTICIHRRFIAASALVAALSGISFADDVERARTPSQPLRSIPPITINAVPVEEARPTILPVAMPRVEPAPVDPMPLLPPLSIDDVPRTYRPKSTKLPTSMEPGLAKPASGSILPASIITYPSGVNLTRPPVQSEEVDENDTPFGLAARAPSFIDQAALLHVARFRADAFWGMNRPDRAEVFYPRQGFLRTAIGAEKPLGPPNWESNVDAHEYSFYVEVLLSNRVSFFTDLPVRYIDPENNANQLGISDIGFGIKCAILQDSAQALTLQLKGIAPSGDGELGLGSEQWIFEPGLLYQRSLGDVMLFAEVRDRIPMGPWSDYAGNVLRYGVGGSVTAFEFAHVKVMPTVEGVGWTVLSGKQTAEFGSPDQLVQDAHGKTMLSAYGGIRFAFGDDMSSLGYLALSDLYVGYGHTFTQDRWYRDIVRVEYRLRF